MGRSSAVRGCAPRFAIRVCVSGLCIHGPRCCCPLPRWKLPILKGFLWETRAPRYRYFRFCMDGLHLLARYVVVSFLPPGEIASASGVRLHFGGLGARITNFQHAKTKISVQPPVFFCTNPFCWTKGQSRDGGVQKREPKAGITTPCRRYAVAARDRATISSDGKDDRSGKDAPW